MNNIWIWIVLAVLAVLITSLRSNSAYNTTKAVRERGEDRQKENESRLRQGLAAHQMNASFAYTGPRAYMAADREKGVLLIHEADDREVNLTEIREVRVIDHSDDYQHCQEMERLRSGVERKSLYLPYGRHSMREVKEGHLRFQEYRDRMVCGLEILMKTGPSVEVNCISGTESVFWEHAENLERLRQFAQDLRGLLR